jgi:hypothetical protein
MTAPTNIAHLVVGAIGEELGASAHRALLRIVAVAMVVVWETRIDFTRPVHIFCERADSGPPRLHRRAVFLSVIEFGSSTSLANWVCPRRHHNHACQVSKSLLCPPEHLPGSCRPIG